MLINYSKNLSNIYLQKCFGKKIITISKSTCVIQDNLFSHLRITTITDFHKCLIKKPILNHLLIENDSTKFHFTKKLFKNQLSGNIPEFLKIILTVLQSKY